ncbi:hypothetical protein A6P39_005035 [Streptomyces sp. FXJ1.172]|uniref:golvesin C-terminal-like domain-containing protein n=1 Tax=Streptomyces sp. FXJ1.172 TaxID=710705 RepID=UPI0007CF0B7D|nr:hypothetical protein [Streptomyces sp. FXJ1.172]WEO93435.1 hypothetical protein A6P39_005035 [Streptomyces sp. FXJ1.172]
MLVVIGLAVTLPAAAATGRQAGGVPAKAPTRADRAAQLTAQLGDGWYRSSDFIVSSVGDATGMHYYIGRESEGFAWRPLATIAPAGVDTASWTGYACTSGTDRYLLATIEPTLATNRPVMLDRGALAYTIDLRTGKVRPVTAGVAMYYHTPGCGTGDTGVLARYLGTDQERTELLTVNLATGRISARHTLAGQYTSAVPLAQGDIVAAHGAEVVRIDRHSRPTPLVRTPGPAYDLMPASDGGFDYLTTDFRTTSQAWHLTGGKATLVASGARTVLAVFPGSRGHNLLSGATKTTTSGAALHRVQARSIPDVMSRQGHAVGFPDKRTSVTKTRGRVPHSLPTLVSSVSGRALDTPAPDSAAPASRALPTPLDVLPGTSRSATPRAATNSPTTPPLCAVPRNDPRRQVRQPVAHQIEWGVDQAVRSGLPTRPDDYADMGLSAYNPSDDLPPPSIHGSSGTVVPPQIELAIFAQESANDQASWHALPGVAGNPLVADYYGGAGNFNVINYPNADCGYGLGQITTGMHVGDTQYSAATQAKIAVDYAENIAASIQILTDKWNQLYDLGIRANGGDPRYVENWYMALWAYNSGIHTADGAGNSGLGWTNNPENTDYKPNRDIFLKASYADAAHPADWPYQEKILGWARTPILDYKGNPSYTGISTDPAIPPFPTFCTAADHCSLSNPDHCGLSTDPAYRYHCWWNWAVSWTDCSSKCNIGTFTYGTVGSPEPASDNPHPPDCSSSLPSNTYIVDDLPSEYNVVGCEPADWTSKGSFTLTQGKDSAGYPISEIDTHQLGAGFGGHLFFTHNYAASDTAHKVTGTWTISLPTKVYHVLAHVPSTGGTTRSAHYVVTAADGTTHDRTVDQYQQQDQWAGIGFFSLGSNATVSLTNTTDDGALSAHDVAFDAIAFVPIDGTLVSHTLDAVSLFDWNQDLNTNVPSSFTTPSRTMTTLHDWAVEYGSYGPDWNTGTGVHSGVASYPVCPTGTLAAGPVLSNSCVPQDVWNIGKKWADDATAAGTSTSGHSSTSMTEPKWLGYSNTDVPPPTTLTSSTFSDDLSYKIKSHLDVSFVIAGGKIVPGSEDLHFRERTGTTHIPDFVGDFMQAVQTDYGITAPNLSYNETDANFFSGDSTHVDPLSSRQAPGRDYVWHADEPSVSSDQSCVLVRTIMGGSIGWRPLAAQTPVAQSVSAWVSTLRSDARVAPPVADMAAELNNFFFSQATLGGTLFLKAPPIWQQIHAKVCADGTIASAAVVDNADETPRRTIADQSYMPNLYLYFDDHMIDNAGGPGTTYVHKGNFAEFANIPGVTSVNGDPYGWCDIAGRGAGGNPWNFEVVPVPSAPDARPKTGAFCDTSAEFGNPYAH